MACLNYEKIQLYIENGLNRIENSIVRDHLLTCHKCHAQYLKQQKIENYLINPPVKKPPAEIEKFVMRKLFSIIPSYASIVSFITVGFVFLISLIYIYFDFANNSLIKAIEITSKETTNYIAIFIKIITTVFSSVYTFFKIIAKIFSHIFNMSLSVNVIIAITLVLFMTILYPLFKKTLKRIRE